MSKLEQNTSKGKTDARFMIFYQTHSTVLHKPILQRQTQQHSYDPNSSKKLKDDDSDTYFR